MTTFPRRHVLGLIAGIAGAGCVSSGEPSHEQPADSGDPASPFGWGEGQWGDGGWGGLATTVS